MRGESLPPVARPSLWLASLGLFALGCSMRESAGSHPQPPPPPETEVAQKAADPSKQGPSKDGVGLGGLGTMGRGSGGGGSSYGRVAPREEGRARLGAKSKPASPRPAAVAPPGGMEGFGRIHGMGRIDTGGGRGGGGAGPALDEALAEALDGVAGVGVADPAARDRRRVGRSRGKASVKGDANRPAKARRRRNTSKSSAGKKAERRTIILEEQLIEGEELEEDGSGQALLHGWDADEDRVATKEVGLLVEDDERSRRPDRFLPRMCYFENTYLGGNAAHQERLRRLDEAFGGQRPYRAARLSTQGFDPPAGAGLSLTARTDRRWIDKPGRVVLEVGLQGSERYGWRRPPIDVALVVDQPVVAQGEAVLVEAVTGLVRRLGPQDRLAVVLVGPKPVVLAPVGAIRDVRRHLANALEVLASPPAVGPGALERAMSHAGDLLQSAARDTARVPGSQTVLLLTHGGGGREAAAVKAAHANNLRGLTNSVIDVSQETQNDWWQVANAGYGNFHRASPEDVLKAVDAELASLSRVIARLMRLNVRLAPGVHAIRVIGSRVLGQQEVVQVKAREEATDRQLSKTLGVEADRGADDDGIQTVIPYFYGGDSHVVLIELWVEKPGPVADVTLKYKDMVTLANATARTSATLASLPRADTPAQRAVRRNLRGFDFAAALDRAGRAVRGGDRSGALATLQQAAGRAVGADAALARRFEQLVAAGHTSERLAEALAVASARRVGYPP